MTENLTNRLYAIGDKETGILFVTLDPLRVSYIAKSELTGYAAANGITVTTLFSDITNAVRLLFNAPSPPKAEFCFVADLPDMNWEENRIPFPPLFDALDYLAGRPAVAGEPPLPATCPDAPQGIHEAWLVALDDERKCRTYSV